MVRMKKGITPIISIIVLLLITIGLVGIAWLYLSGYILGRTEKTIESPYGGSWCDSSGAYVTLTNTGTQDIVAGDITIGVIGTDSGLGAGTTIASRQSAIIQSANCGAASCPSGWVDYRFVAQSSVIEGQVHCP